MKLCIVSYKCSTVHAVGNRTCTNASPSIQVMTFDAGFLFQSPYNLRKQESGNTQGTLSTFVNGELRYTKEAFRPLNIIAGVRDSKKKQRS